MAVGLVHTVVSISACGAEHPGSIQKLLLLILFLFLHLWHAHFSYAENDHISELATGLHQSKKDNTVKRCLAGSSNFCI